ncbi:hypothetical protein DL93DRAFT_2164641 [Clavulina sp. PMI_390]|nr:hypothetical protein DL93DRAFT_2164641 [Clavulina sp. PMI_390]
MSVAAWAASVHGKDSPPSSAPGDWNRPALDIRHSVWDMKQASPFFIVDGTVDLDTRFFIGPNGYFYDFSITLALDTPDLPHSIDWNSEGRARRNPNSIIWMDEGRITIDENFTSIRFEIQFPTNVLWFPRPGEARSFAIKAKAFAVQAPHIMTETNETSFVVMNRVGMAPIVGQRRNSSWQL